MIKNHFFFNLFKSYEFTFDILTLIYRKTEEGPVILESFFSKINASLTESLN